jgi:hypothetical protein
VFLPPPSPHVLLFASGTSIFIHTRSTKNTRICSYQWPTNYLTLKVQKQHIKGRSVYTVPTQYHGVK